MKRPSAKAEAAPSVAREGWWVGRENEDGDVKALPDEAVVDASAKMWATRLKGP